MIYFAPLQGFTDYIYRKVYASHFGGIDTFFIPYISIKNNNILPKYIREILPENNPDIKTIPQVLASDSNELLFLANELNNYSYTKINLNMGCPYPMVTNREKGAGLLPHPDKIKRMLGDFFEKTNLKLSVKLRAGLHSESEIEKVIPVLNTFPLTEIIFHPRIASQLYKGEVSESAFSYAAKNCKHQLVYNGDVFSLRDFEKKSTRFPEIKTWMIGRGILMNPFLPAEINGKQFSSDEKQEKLFNFHQHIFETYLEKMDNPGNVLTKMKQFWIYFSFNFEKQQKVLKKVKKIKSSEKYRTEISEIRNSFDLVK